MDPVQQPHNPQPRTPTAFDARMVIENLRELAPKIHLERSVDLSGLLLVARNSGVTLPVPPERVQSASAMEALTSIALLNRTILLPRGMVAIANIVGGTTHLAMGSFTPRTVIEVPVVGGTVKSVDVEWQRMMPNCPGLAVSDYACVDRRRANEDALSMWRQLPLMQQQFSLARQLTQHVRARGWSAKEYQEHCGYSRIKANVIEVATNGVYFSAFGLPHYGADNPLETVKLVLKPESNLRALLKGWDSRSTLGNSFVAVSITHFCASLRGILREVDGALERNDFALAAIVAKDYLLSELLRAQMDRDDPAGNALEVTSSRFLTSAFADLVIGSEADLAARVNGATDKDSALAARHLLQRTYEADFRSESERVDLINDPRKLS